MNDKQGKWHRHIGVYGVCINENNEMLVIIKNGGPYDGLYDLPGGSFENPESISGCLKREMLEETLAEIEIKDSLGAVDVLIDSPYDGYDYTHHIALLYLIEIKKYTRKMITKYVETSDTLIENDSLGCKWVNIKNLNCMNSSPLIMKTCNMINDDKDYELIKFYV